METRIKDLYETPACEIVEVNLENSLLQGSQPMRAARRGYGDATEENWE